MGKSFGSSKGKRTLLGRLLTWFPSCLHIIYIIMNSPLITKNSPPVCHSLRGPPTLHRNQGFLIMFREPQNCGLPSLSPPFSGESCHPCSLEVPLHSVRMRRSGFLPPTDPVCVAACRPEVLGLSWPPS